MTGEGPFKDAADGTSTPGRLLRQVVTNYVLKDRTVTKYTVTRSFLDNARGDYIDHSSSEPLVTIYDNEDV
tara:strand:+ start:2488 stop:2700 length:213 start_codon:yes stop_codon:yes gene_type:complete